jgi:hypothetical protein
MPKMTRDEYLQTLFGGEDSDPTDRQKKAFDLAHDIRKFEIGLYWQRAAYFWTFISVTFGALYVVDDKFEFLYIVACFGFVFSLAWYFVNRGSKAWQKNWESHVDLLEDELSGPLYKTIINKKTFEFRNLLDGYPFSPSKINHILSLFVTGVWAFLVFRAAAKMDWSHIPHRWAFLVTTGLTITALIFLCQAKTSPSQTDIVVDVESRTYKPK